MSRFSVPFQAPFGRFYYFRKVPVLSLHPFLFGFFFFLACIVIKSWRVFSCEFQNLYSLFGIKSHFSLGIFMYVIYHILSGSILLAVLFNLLVFMVSHLPYCFFVFCFINLCSHINSWPLCFRGLFCWAFIPLVFNLYFCLLR